MEERLLDLLRIVVEDYVATGEPVGSQRLVDEYALDVSPATVRNWFAELEEAGCLFQPHVSGGRVPTEKGFQTYVTHFVDSKPVSKREQEELKQAATRTLEDARRLKQVAKVLAELSGQAVVVGFERADTFYTGLSQLFTQPEFKNWERVVNLTEILDHLDEVLSALRTQRFSEPHILIGRACPFGPVCGSVIISFDGGICGVLGPVRMDYPRAFSLMQTVLPLFSSFYG